MIAYFKIIYSYIQYYFPIGAKVTLIQIISLIFFPKLIKFKNFRNKPLEEMVKSYLVIFSELRKNRFLFFEKDLLNNHLSNFGLKISRQYKINPTLIRFSRFYQKFEKDIYNFLIKELSKKKQNDYIAIINYRKNRYINFRPFGSENYTGVSSNGKIKTAHFEMTKIVNDEFYYTYGVQSCFLIIFNFKNKTLIKHNKNIPENNSMKKKKFYDMLQDIKFKNEKLESIVLFSHNTQNIEKLTTKIFNTKIKTYKISRDKLNNFKIHRNNNKLIISSYHTESKTGKVEDFFPINYNLIA